MCLQQRIQRSKSLYHHFQLSQSPRATLRCCSFPPYSGNDRLYTNSRSSLLTEGSHDDNDDHASHQRGSDEFNPSDPSSPHANTNLATPEAYVGSNPSEHVVDLHGENTVFAPAHSRPRVTPSGWIFFLISVGLEISSAAVDQVSSRRKPHYAQISLWIAIANVVLCIWELIHGRMKDIDASSNGMVYRSLPDILGLGLAVIQCAWSAAQYCNPHQQTSNPIKQSTLALYLVVCLMVLKYEWRG